MEYRRILPTSIIEVTINGYSPTRWPRTCFALWQTTVKKNLWVEKKTSKFGRHVYKGFRTREGFLIFLREFMPIRNWYLSPVPTLNQLMATTYLLSVFKVLKFCHKFTFIFEVSTTLKHLTVYKFQILRRKQIKKLSGSRSLRLSCIVPLTLSIIQRERLY